MLHLAQALLAPYGLSASAIAEPCQVQVPPYGSQFEPGRLGLSHSPRSTIECATIPTQALCYPSCFLVSAPTHRPPIAGTSQNSRLKRVSYRFVAQARDLQSATSSSSEEPPAGDPRPLIRRHRVVGVALDLRVQHRRAHCPRSKLRLSRSALGTSGRQHRLTRSIASRSSLKAVSNSSNRTLTTSPADLSRMRWCRVCLR